MKTFVSIDKNNVMKIFFAIDKSVDSGGVEGSWTDWSARSLCCQKGIWAAHKAG